MLRLVQLATQPPWFKNDSAISIEQIEEDEANITNEKTLFNEQLHNNNLIDPRDQVAHQLLLQSQISSKLISSPYPDLVNQLDLSTLDLSSKLFALALTILTPTRPDYATAPYLESFNWSEVFALLRSLSTQSNLKWTSTKFYVVIFRSKLKPNIDRDRLGLLDQKSHEEACASGGLLKYWFGEPDADRRNLATCLWRNYGDAVDGGKGPWHAQARLAAREMYESITFHTHLLTIGDGAKEWSIEDFERMR